MSGTRILIADEDVRARASMSALLEGADYLIVGEVSDYDSIVSLTRQLRPDIVLLDIKLPGGEELAAAQALYQEDLAPVIVTTAHNSRELVMEARAAGVLGYLVKPIKDSELMPAIEVARSRWVEQHARKRELAQLRDKIETRKVIERAKGYLMDSQGLQEAEAFRKIQRLAMNSRKTMREVAQAILLTQQIQP